MNYQISDDLFELRADIEAWQRIISIPSVFTPFLRVGKGGDLKVLYNL